MDAGKRLLLFDGVCNVCNALVLFIIDRDPRERFVFASLQSDLGRSTLVQHGLSPDDMNTVVLVHEGRVYTRSDAALQVVKNLRFPWPLLYAGRIVPRALRDFLYAQFAARRYRWFGKSDSCRIPTPELRRRFLA